MMILTDSPKPPESLTRAEHLTRQDLSAQTNIPISSLGKATIPTGFYLHGIKATWFAWLMPYVLAESGLWIQAGIVTPSTEMVVVHVFNMTSRPIRIKRDTKLACLSSVAEA